jgi:HNH endonuclease/NUMOD4 motif
MMGGEMNESWLPVTGYEDSYLASDLGRVYSLLTGIILKQHPNGSGHLRVRLYRSGTSRLVLVHLIVLEAFEGECPEGLEACHWDDVPSNNKLSNLRWDTRIANRADMARNGHNFWSSRDECANGHEFTPENTRVRTDSGRACRKCDRDKAARSRARRAA